MMQNKSFFLSIGFILLVFFTMGCSRSASSSSRTSTPYSVNAAAAQTIAAQLTQISVPGTINPIATQSENPQKVVGTLKPVTISTLHPKGLPEKPPTDDPKNYLEAPTRKDNFANDTPWPYFSDQHVKMNIVNGQLSMTALLPEKWESWMFSPPNLTNFYIEETAQAGKCQSLDRYGLIVRSPNFNSGYLLGFSCDGQYSLRIFNGTDFSFIIKWTPSDWIRKTPDQTNLLGILARNDELSVYANGHLLNTINDQNYSQGAFGLFINSQNSGNFNVMVSEVAYWELP